MKTSDFDYDLPVEFIAQTPVEPRDASRLLVMDRKSGKVSHTVFREIGRYLNPGDLMVLNETRVMPARLPSRKLPGGGRAEILLLSKVDDDIWEAIVGGQGLKEGRRVQVIEGPVAEIIQVFEGSRRLVRFDLPVEPFLKKVGQMPLPPYIHACLEDPERYQTVFSRQLGSAAAPTAGLHFTPELLDELQVAGIEFAYVTLHVGLDTFAPVTEEDPSEHLIHTEWCELSSGTAQAINSARQKGGRVVAVGTTSVRTVESAARGAAPEGIVPYNGPTALYILPGYDFRAVDAMLTNFHLPRSTLIMLVSAFAGRELTLHAYEVAKQEGYRFYSFGDAMLIL
jgi:S-adenosylmethionine:tRNA ribosyltransferase-isomerase